MDPVVVQEQAAEIFHAAKRIITMCKDLNLFAHQSTPKECVPVNLTQQLKEAMKIAKYALGLENMTVVQAYSSHPNSLARLTEIVQVFVNLIINTLQAIDGHGTLTLGASCTDRIATIKIGDTGPGIPAEKMEKISNRSIQRNPRGGNRLRLSISSLPRRTPWWRNRDSQYSRERHDFPPTLFTFTRGELRSNILPTVFCQ